MSDIYSISKKCSKSIKFKKLLHKYLELCDEYTQVFEYEDAVFGYTEMANVSLLSTAAWKQNWFSLVEYQSQKYRGKNFKENNKKKYKQGRVDLYICDDSQEEYICEAKQYFTKSDAVSCKASLAKLESAYDDVCRSTRDAEGERYDGYAIVFLPHLILAGLDRPKVMERQKKLKLSLKKLYDFEENGKSKIDGYGYYFPEETIKEWTRDGRHNLIGISVIFKRVER